MSDDLVNQITLNFLISKQQMQKLNKKIKQKEEDKMKTDMEIYREQIVELFTKFINDEFPDDLLEDVKHSYTYFIEKSIYYLKMHSDLTIEANVETNESLTVDTNLEDDLEEEDLNDDISDNNEESLEDDEDISDNDEEGLEDDTVASLDDDISETVASLDDELEDETTNKVASLDDELEDESTNDVVEAVNLENEVANKVANEAVAIKEELVYPRVYKKLHKSTNSKGVDDIQKLPLDWFNTVRQNYKQNQIIPRQKDKKEIVLKSPNNYKNTEKKNISNLYEGKPKDKKNTK